MVVTASIPTITAVIPHYFPERVPSLVAACEALRQGTVAPDEILVWNNDQPLGVTIPGVAIIQSHRNLGPQARFLAALAAQGGLIFFQDNDVAVLPRTLEVLRDRYLADPDEVVESLDGRRLTAEGGYRSSTWLRPGTEEEGADLTLGRGELIAAYALRRALAHFDWDCPMDDLAFSHALRQIRVPIRVVPAFAGVGLRNLPEGGVGARLGEGHYRERDRLCRQWWPR